MVKFASLVELANTTAYKTEPIFTGLGMANCPKRAGTELSRFN